MAGTYQPPGYTGYNPAQPGYNPPAPAYYPQAGVQQQTTNTVVVVQPQSTVTKVFRPVGDYYYTASIVLSFICFFCGSWFALCCTIPAIFVASSAKEAAARGDVAAAKSSGNVALGLNIAAVVSYVVLWAVIIGLSAGLRSTTTCVLNSGGYYYYCY